MKLKAKFFFSWLFLFIGPSTNLCKSATTAKTSATAAATITTATTTAAATANV